MTWYGTCNIWYMIHDMWKIWHGSGMICYVMAWCDKFGVVWDNMRPYDPICVAQKHQNARRENIIPVVAICISFFALLYIQHHAT